MGQQPNVELTESDQPRSVPQPPPARRWRPTKPGLITAPEQVPSGGTFGTIGPDPGWALRLLTKAELPNDDPDLRWVLGRLMTVRSAIFGRAPIMEDLDAALALCGYGYDAPPEVIERRDGWLAAVPHEARPGQTAVSEVDRELIQAQPEQIRYVLTRGE